MAKEKFYLINHLANNLKGKSLIFIIISTDVCDRVLNAPKRTLPIDGKRTDGFCVGNIFIKSSMMAAMATAAMPMDKR